MHVCVTLVLCLSTQAISSSPRQFPSGTRYRVASIDHVFSLPSASLALLISYTKPAPARQRLLEISRLFVKPSCTWTWHVIWYAMRPCHTAPPTLTCWSDLSSDDFIAECVIFPEPWIKKQLFGSLQENLHRYWQTLLTRGESFHSQQWVINANY